MLASRAVSPPAPSAGDMSLAWPRFGWQSFSSGAGLSLRAQAQQCSSALCEHREGFSAADTAPTKLSPERPRVTWHRAEAVPRPPQIAKGFLPFTEQLLPAVRIKHKEKHNQTY